MSTEAVIYSSNSLCLMRVHIICIFCACNIRWHVCTVGVYKCDDVAQKSVCMCRELCICVVGGLQTSLGASLGPLLYHCPPDGLCLGCKAGGGHGHPASWVISQGLMSSLGMTPPPFPGDLKWGAGPKLAWSSWLIFLASIDPAASPESISSPQVKISPIASPDLRQGGIHSNLFKQRKAFPSDLYSNLFQAGRGSG